MLVLSRKRGQTIKLSGGITITLIGIRGSQVHIGVEAPPEVNIYRGELDQTDRQAKAKPCSTTSQTAT